MAPTFDRVGHDSEAVPRCTLHGSLGRVEPCPGADCAFWDEPAKHCALGGLELELVHRPEVAEHLLELRTSLERARPESR